jgi:hypothetical protein
MLVQEAGAKILLLPAWPSEWDVDFKLHLAGGAVLTGTVQDGKLLRWDLTPSARRNGVEVGQPARNTNRMKLSMKTPRTQRPLLAARLLRPTHAIPADELEPRFDHPPAATMARGLWMWMRCHLGQT